MESIREPNTQLPEANQELSQHPDLVSEAKMLAESKEAQQHKLGRAYATLIKACIRIQTEVQGDLSHGEVCST